MNTSEIATGKLFESENSKIILERLSSTDDNAYFSVTLKCKGFIGMSGKMAYALEIGEVNKVLFEDAKRCIKEIIKRDYANMFNNGICAKCREEIANEVPK